ncbi:MAG: ATP-binding protein [Polymorphobacter sp.]
MNSAGPAPPSMMPPKVASMFEALPVGLALLDQRDHLLMCNSAFVASFAIVDDPRGQDPLAMIIAADRPIFRDMLAQVRREVDGAGELRVRLVARPDEYVTLTLTYSPPVANIMGSELLIAVRDLREQLRFEAKVAQVTKMQAVGQLAGGVAHDFNNVLTAVLGLCDQLLLRHFPGDPDFDDIEQIRVNANRAAALVRQLLAFARQQTLQPQLLDVHSVLEPLRPLLQRLIGPGIALDISYAPDVGRVRADPGQLEQVVVNLAVNARDAMDKSGQLAISVRPVAATNVARLGYDVMPRLDFVELAVSDTGSGISPEIAARIFEPFFTTKEIGHGTGLGLASVYGIVKQSDGFIFMTQRPAGGTCFAIYLPADHSAVVAPAAPAAPLPRPAPARRRVLLVEDERPVRLVVERLLQRLDFDVSSAADASEAFELLDRHDGGFELLITDLVMPGLDGFELIHQALARYPHLKTILMSGYAEPPQRAAFAIGETIFLAKPFASDALVTATNLAIGDIKS